MPVKIRQPNNSNQVTSGNQFVQTRDGSVNYADIPLDQYSKVMGGAFGQTTDAQGRILNQIASLSKQSPLNQATAYSTTRTADAAYLQAQAALEQAKSNSQSNRPYTPNSRDRLFNPEYQSAMSYENKMRDGINRFKPQIEFANNKANRQSEMDLNKLLATSRVNEARINAGAGVSQARINSEGRLGEARINADAGIEQTKTNADAQIREARIQQPLSSGQVLEQSRIQNPDPMKSMAMNMLGGYVNQGTRSNFAYWG